MATLFELTTILTNTIGNIAYAPCEGGTIPCADLPADGRAEIPGYVERTFFAEVSANDPRLCEGTVRRLALVLQKIAVAWLHEHTRDSRRWACDMPEVKVFADKAKNLVRWTVTVYVFDALVPNVGFLARGEEE